MLFLFQITSYLSDKTLPEECGGCLHIGYIIATALIACVLTGIAAALFGFLIGIHCQKNNLIKKTGCLNENEKTHARNSVELENTPVYEEVRNEFKDIELECNIAYETINNS